MKSTVHNKEILAVYGRALATPVMVDGCRYVIDLTGRKLTDNNQVKITKLLQQQVGLDKELTKSELQAASNALFKECSVLGSVTVSRAWNESSPQDVRYSINASLYTSLNNPTPVKLLDW